MIRKSLIRNYLPIETPRVSDADDLINAGMGDAAATLFMVYRCDTGDELAAVCYLLYANRFSGSSRNGRHINFRDDTDNCDRFQRARERKAPFSFRKRAI